jgi:hypothetical protein
MVYIKTKNNKTKTIQRNWQHGVHKTKNNKTKTIQRNWQHGVHKTKNNKTKTQHNCLLRSRNYLPFASTRVEPGFWGGFCFCVSHVFSFLCCPIMCLYVPSYKHL